MTIKELSKYRKYSVKIKALKEEIERMRDKSPGLCAKYGGSAGHSGAISDNVGNMAAAIADKVSELERMQALCVAERERINNYIKSVKDMDPLIYGMMYARFIKCQSWKAVALYAGGDNTADSCRKAVFRYCGK